MINIQPNIPFNPFEGLPDDTDPDLVLGIALKEKEEASDGAEFLDCRVLFPARSESRYIPIRLLSGDDAPEDRLPGVTGFRGEGVIFGLINLHANKPFFACIGRRELNEQTSPSP